MTNARLNRLRARGPHRQGWRIARTLTSHGLNAPNTTVDDHEEETGALQRPIEVSNDLQEIADLIR